MRSEIKADKWSPASGTAGTIGDSGDTYTVPSGVTLAVASGATITNSGTATGFGGANTPMWYVERTSDQSLTKNTYTKIEWNHEEIDTDSAFSSYKFTVPSGKAGKYYITAGLGFYDNVEQAHHYVQIYKNGSNISATPSGISTVADDTDRYWQTNTMIADLAVSDYIEIYGYFGALGSDTTATVNYSYFTGYKLIT